MSAEMRGVTVSRFVWKSLSEMSQYAETTSCMKTCLMSVHPNVLVTWFLVAVWRMHLYLCGMR